MIISHNYNIFFLRSVQHQYKFLDALGVVDMYV